MKTRALELLCDDSISFMQNTDRRWEMVFADPPDNIGLKYEGYRDKLSPLEYSAFLNAIVAGSMRVSDVLWLSFNSRHTLAVADAVRSTGEDFDVKPCIQTFTFFQQRSSDLGNANRPLWRVSRRGKLRLYPEAIRIPSWRLLNGDKRANPDGMVPGDVFDFPRVTGNSKAKRKWHKTQLNEGLVERAIKLCTEEGDRVLDPFAGTGTTGRVCDRIGRHCTMIENSQVYCDRIAEEWANG